MRRLRPGALCVLCGIPDTLSVLVAGLKEMGRVLRWLVSSCIFLLVNAGLKVILDQDPCSLFQRSPTGNERAHIACLRIVHMPLYGTDISPIDMNADAWHIRSAADAVNVSVGGATDYHFSFCDISLPGLLVEARGDVSQSL